MTSLAIDLKQTIQRRVEHASSSEILRLTSALCALEISAPPPERGANRLLEDAFKGRFEKLDANGFSVAGGDAHVLTRDNSTGLIWTRDALPCGRKSWKDAQTAAAEVSYMGARNWRLPTIHELLSLVDYEKHSPAIDTDHFKCESAWFWTSTPAAYSPSAYAWNVGFVHGVAGWNLQGSSGFVRAVRPGQ